MKLVAVLHEAFDIEGGLYALRHGSLSMVGSSPMDNSNRHPSGSPSDADQRRDELLRRALVTPPISNEDIVKRSKESQGK